MPGEPLMCVWQAVLAKDIFPESGVKRATVMSIVENFDSIQGIRYSERRFKEVFTESKVEFSVFKEYVQKSLCAPSVPLPILMEHIEFECWGMVCNNFFTSEALNQDDLMKIWNIFNRLCTPGTYPPRISKTYTNFLFEKIADNLGKTWGSSTSIPEDGYTFQEMINTLDKSYFSVTSTAVVSQCIEDLHAWLVREVMKTGWLFKRTRKNSNWTNWLKRWFIMTPGHLKYYENEKQKVLKGDIIIDKNSLAEHMDAFKSLMSKMEHRFKMTNEPHLVLEMSAETRCEKELWVKKLKQNSEAMKTGITPQMRLLQERDQQLKQDKKESLVSTNDKMESAQTLARNASRRYVDVPKKKKVPTATLR